MSITNGYTALATAKARIGISDADDDAIIEAVITAVSREIDDYCGRRFYAVSETRYYDARSSSFVLVDDLLSVSELKTDDAGDRTYGTTWAVTDYDLLPANAAMDGRSYWQIAAAPNGDYAFPTGVAKGVKVTGSFGYAATTPAAVEEACLFQVALEFTSRHAPVGVMGGGDVATQVRSTGLHPFSKRILDPYRRMVFA